MTRRWRGPSLGASSLLLGALAAFFLPIGKRLLGMIMGFGAGVLISAVAYGLVEEAVVTAADPFAIAAGFALGAVVFYAGTLLIDRRLSGPRARRAASRSSWARSSTASPSPS